MAAKKERKMKPFNELRPHLRSEGLHKKWQIDRRLSVLRHESGRHIKLTDLPKRDLA